MAPNGRVRWLREARGGRFGNLFFAWLAQRRSVRLASFFLFWVTLYFLIAAPAARKASFTLARRIGRGRSFFRRLSFALQHFFTYGTMLFDRLVILRGHGNLYQFDLHGERTVKEVVSDGRGSIFLTAHLGNWDVMGQFLSQLHVSVTVVMFDGVEEPMRSTMEELSKGRSFHVLYSDGSPASAAAVLSALSRGHVVGMMGDRILNSRGIRVPFLGGTALLPIGPFALAAAARVPLIYTFAFREKSRHYSLHALNAGMLEYTTPGKRDADIEAWAANFARCLEGFVRKYPTQWCNFYPFWLEEAKLETMWPTKRGRD